MFLSSTQNAQEKNVTHAENTEYATSKQLDIFFYSSFHFKKK